MGDLLLVARVVALSFGLLAASAAESPRLKPQTTQVAPGIWRLRFGEPEAFTPERFRHKPPMTQAIGSCHAAKHPSRWTPLSASFRPVAA